MHLTQYAMAPGWDADEEDLEFIGEIVPEGDIAFPEPIGAQSGFNPGVIKQRLDLMLTRVGVNRQTFLLGGITYPQYRHIQATYCGGGYSGKVTLQTRWQGNDYAI